MRRGRVQEVTVLILLCDLQHDNDEKNERINVMGLQLDALNRSKEDVEIALEESEKSRGVLQQVVHKKEAELDREQKRRERLEKEFKETTAKLQARVRCLCLYLSPCQKAATVIIRCGIANVFHRCRSRMSSISR